MNFFKKGELKLLWPFYLESFISKVFMILPGFMIVYFTGLNLTMFQISILLAVGPLFSLLSEIPTGAIADLYGRKFSVLVGVFILGISAIIPFFYEKYFALLVSMAFIGFSSTFISGAWEAWVTDNINKKNKELLHDFFAKSMSFTSLGFVLSGLIGAFFVKNYGIKIIWLATSVSFLISFIILLFAKEDHVKKRSNLKNSIKDIKNKTKVSLKYCYKNKQLFYVLITTIILVFAFGFNSLLTWTPILKSYNFPDYAYGYLISAISFIGIFAPLISLRLAKKIKIKRLLILSSMGFLIFMLSIIIITGLPLFFVVILGAMFFQYMIIPSASTYFQSFIPSKLRATVTSIQSMFMSIGGIISLPLIGFMVDTIGAKTTMFISGFLIIPAIWIYWKYLE